MFLLHDMAPRCGILADRRCAAWILVYAEAVPMRTSYVPIRSRRILCVSPRYAPSFGTFQHAYPFFGRRVRAFMPPQGLLVIAAYLPERWEVRFVDENISAAGE